MKLEDQESEAQLVLYDDFLYAFHSLRKVERLSLLPSNLNKGKSLWETLDIRYNTEIQHIVPLNKL